MPDANKENTINQLVGAAFGAAGQRCMALSTAIFVGESRQWVPELVERSKSLRVNAGNFKVNRQWEERKKKCHDSAFCGWDVLTCAFVS